MTTHTREYALDERQFELLLEGAQRIPDDQQSLEAQFVVLVGGRLGLRPGEIIHLQEDWIDWRTRRITIPRQQDCSLGLEGGVCGYCEQLARQMVDHYDADDVSDDRLRFYNRHLSGGFQRGDELTVDDCLEMRWIAKTDAAAREVPFSFDPRVELVVERFFESPHRDRWGLSKSSLNRRLSWAIEEADELAAGVTTPHGLRGTAASYHAGRGLGVLELQSLFGWADLQTAQYYIQNSPENTERALHQVHSI